MTSGQHVEGECAFCVSVTRAFAKVPRWQRMLQSTRHDQAWIVTDVPSSPVNLQSVANFDTPPELDSRCGLSLPLARVNSVSVPTRVVRLLTHSAKQARFQVPRVVFPQAPRTLARSPSASWFHLSQWLSLLICRPSACTHHPIRVLVTSLKIVPPGLQNTMTLPLSATRSTVMIDLCKQVVLGAIWKSPDTLTPSSVRMKIGVLPVVVSRCPVADVRSTTAPLDLPPRQSDKLC